jgi:hypothetical protein
MKPDEKPSEVESKPKKKPYMPPRLRKLGTVSELTGMGGSGEGRRKPHG